MRLGPGQREGLLDLSWLWPRAASGPGASAFSSARRGPNYLLPVWMKPGRRAGVARESSGLWVLLGLYVLVASVLGNQ